MTKNLIHLLSYKLLNKKSIEVMSLIILVITSATLRFKYLGYSDYIGDEHKSFIQPESGQTTWNFLLEQRKGPMQFFVSQIPYLITHNFRNELAERIPYAIISVINVFILYFLIKKLTKNNLIAFTSAFLFSVNGFIVGFGRIAQYQNLNMLFSFLAVYFYADLIFRKEKLQKSTLLGTIFWSLSILSHWDAIFIIPLVAYFWIRWLADKNISKSEKLRLILLNFIVGCFLLLPFLAPYVNYQFHDQENMDYFGRRIEFGHINNERYKMLIDLYNPFVAFWYLVIFGLIGLIYIKQNYIFLLWFVFSYSFFELFVRKPGTHIYNFIIPLIVLSSYGVYFLVRKLPKIMKYVFSFGIVVIFSFLFYQSYMIFIDHKVEYPWNREKILVIESIGNSKKSKKKGEEKLLIDWETPEYTIDQKLPLFGFPHSRYWNEIDTYLKEQNAYNNTSCSYVTNEVKTIAEWYVDTEYSPENCFYFVGIKYPLSFVNDWSYDQLGKKDKILEMENEYGTTVVRIYKSRDE